jgi:hypothetical protein
MSLPCEVAMLWLGVQRYEDCQTSREIDICGPGILGVVFAFGVGVAAILWIKATCATGVRIKERESTEFRGEHTSISFMDDEENPGIYLHSDNVSSDEEN